MSTTGTGREHTGGAGKAQRVPEHRAGSMPRVPDAAARLGGAVGGAEEALPVQPAHGRCPRQAVVQRQRRRHRGRRRRDPAQHPPHRRHRPGAPRDCA